MKINSIRILIILLLLSGRAALACICDGLVSVNDAYKASVIVVAGEVISKTTEWTPDSSEIKKLIESGEAKDSTEIKPTGLYLTKVLLKVEKVYKGIATSDTLTIYTGINGAACGSRFTAGEKYIIYGSSKTYFGNTFMPEENYPSGQNTYWTNSCTRTMLYNNTEAGELEKIGK